MEELVYRLKMSGIGIAVVGDQIKLDIPEGKDVSALVSEVRHHKQALLLYVRKSQPDPLSRTPAPRLVEKKEHYEVFHQQKKEYLRYLILGDHSFNSNFILSSDHPDLPTLHRALRTLFFRHESLRTTFLRKDGQLRQVIHGIDTVTLNVEYLDLSAEGNKQELADRLLEQSAGRRFDFEKELLSDIKLVRYLPDAYYLLFTTHHAICDAFSSAILKREIGLLYQAYLQGDDDPLPPLTFQYKDYAFWANRCLKGRYGREAQTFYKGTIGRSLAEEVAVAGGVQQWSSGYRQRLREELIRVQGPTGPARFPEAFGAVVNLLPEKGGFYKTYIEGDVIGRLKRTTLEKGATFFSVLLTAFALLLSRETKVRTARISVPHTTRLFEEFENIVGWLTSEIIVCIPVDPSMHLDRMLEEVAAIIQAASDHCIYPHEKILDDMDIPLEVMAPALLNYIGDPDAGMPRFQPYHTDNGSGHFNLHCKVTEYSDGMTVEMNYNVHVYARSRV
ncbi:MAG TPA: condensation domain-containing protein, partial [Puia sp.]|nr:condensation domain-containing protein [Puia sp.]